MSDSKMLFECIHLVTEFFERGGDVSKAVVWFETENLNFGNIKPISFITTGRIKKLHAFIKTQIEENGP